MKKIFGAISIILVLILIFFFNDIAFLTKISFDYDIGSKKAEEILEEYKSTYCDSRDSYLKYYFNKVCKEEIIRHEHGMVVNGIGIIDIWVSSGYWDKSTFDEYDSRSMILDYYNITNWSIDSLKKEMGEKLNLADYVAKISSRFKKFAIIVCGGDKELVDSILADIKNKTDFEHEDLFLKIKW